MIGQTLTLGPTPATLVQPTSDLRIIVIQNNGSNSIRLSIDGGSITSYPNGATGTDPTATTGYLLKSSAQLQINYDQGFAQKVIRALAPSGSTTIDLIADDPNTTFPTP